MVHDPPDRVQRGLDRALGPRGCPGDVVAGDEDAALFGRHLKSFSPRTPTPRIEPIFTQEAFKSHDQSVKEIWNILQKQPDWNVDQAIADQYHDYLITLDQTSKALLQAHINYIEQRIWQQTSGDRYKSYKDHQIMMEVIYKNALKLHAYGTESGE